jgi:hypothetical protein
MKWLENNFVLVAALLAVLMVLAKVGGLFTSIGKLFGATDPEKDANLAAASHHLQKPERPADGASQATQKQYAERMAVYSAAVCAHTLYSIMDRINPWGREDDLMGMLRTAVQQHLSLSSIEAEYLLFSNGQPLLTHLQRYLSTANYRWFLSNIKSK